MPGPPATETTVGSPGEARASAVVGIVFQRGDEAQAIGAAAEEDGDERLAIVPVAGEQCLGGHKSAALERRRGERDGEHRDEQPVRPLAEEHQEAGQGQRPQQVELLLHRQRPQVAQQGRPLELVEVGLVLTAIETRSS